MSKTIFDFAIKNMKRSELAYLLLAVLLWIIISFIGGVPPYQDEKIMKISMVIIVLAGYGVHKLISHKKYIPKFGVLWYKKTIPICPTHKITMCEKNYANGFSSVICLKCGNEIMLHDEDGKNILIKTARELLNKT
jgi:hypothetical protein